MRRAVFIVLILLLVVLSAQRCSNLRELTGRRSTPEQFTPAEGPKLNLQDVQVLSALDSEYVKLVDSVMPSVVAITTLGRVRVPQAIDPYDYFFGRRARTVERTQSGLGSGVIVSKEGHILTNFHVVKGMEQFRVQLHDGRTEAAEFIGGDENIDIAVLRIRANNITPLPLGDSDNIRVGQMVFAVGTPYGFQETVTQGIISAKGRALSDSGPELLQTDAAVNPGNSGGPLLNLRGEIVGINNAIFSQTGSWAGISFAIPSNTARRTMEAILQNRPPTRAYLGVTMMDLNPALSRQLQLGDVRGVLVADVAGGSPAEKAGLQEGDVITKFAGRPVSDVRDLRRRLMDSEVGAKAEIVVYRQGKEMTLNAQLAEMPADLSAARVPQAPVPAQPGRRLPPQSKNAPRSAPGQNSPAPEEENVLTGIEVSEIPPQMRATLPEAVKGGVVVTQLSPDTPAAQTLRPGDVIEQVNQQSVRSVAEYQKAAASVSPEADRVLLFVCRGKTRSFVVITP